MNLQNETAQKVLECACEVFSEKGFFEASISDICGKAEANRAAVNYYFRSKKALYEQAFIHAYDCSREVHPRAGGQTDTPEKKLRNYIGSVIHGIFDDGTGGWFNRMMFHEVVSPTEVIKTVILERIIKERGYLDQIISELTGETDPEVLHFLNMSVMSQCLVFNMTRNLRKYKKENKVPPFDRPDFNAKDMMENIIEHVYQFSLKGLLANRKKEE